MPLTLEIVTPEGRVYSETVDTVVLPTLQGEIGILPGHLPLLTQIEDGELRVQKGTTTESLACGRGFAEITADRISVLAEQAIDIAKIDEAAVENACRRAEAALAQKQNLSAEEAERLEGVVRFAYAQLDVKRRRRG